MVSAIIPFREREENNNISYCIDYLSKCKHLNEIIVVNQSTKEFDRLDIINNPKTRIVSNPYDGPFSRSWAINIGIKQSESDIISVVDADCIMSSDYFSLATQNILTNKHCYTLHGFIYTNSVEEAKTMPYGLHRIRSECQGHITIHKDLLFQVNGFNEKIRHWGFEDNDMINRLSYHGFQMRHGYNHNEVVYHMQHKIANHEFNIINQGFIKNDNSEQTEWGSINHVPNFYI